MAIDSAVRLESLILLRHKDCGVTGWEDAKLRDVLRERAPQRTEEIDQMRFGQFGEYAFDKKPPLFLLS